MDSMVLAVLWFPFLFPKTTGRIAAEIFRAYRAALEEKP